ncbi:hypothetical protein EX30DRAFT_262890 [Ascodesmis nigricans]|uniref:Uncharacterized protein n=1 Tax=Ascodesmis nigricans TaxID=341454 RepID=A0A4V6RHF3_9PEZI|nr:hypothetical protein EX30DRAFT_262890 [Ascodesmis nigricans]
MPYSRQSTSLDSNHKFVHGQCFSTMCVLCFTVIYSATWNRTLSICRSIKIPVLVGKLLYRGIRSRTNRTTNVILQGQGSAESRNRYSALYTYSYSTGGREGFGLDSNWGAVRKEGLD